MNSFSKNKGEYKEPQISKRHLSTYLMIFITAPVITYVIGKWVDDYFNLPLFPPLPLNLLLGFMVFVLGLAIGIRSTRVLLKSGGGLPWGEFNDKSQTKMLVTSGPYEYTRNPMALGYSLLPCGMGLMFQSVGMTVSIPLVTLLAALVVAKILEEPSLERRFGKTYLEYKLRTPFLIPHLSLLLQVAAKKITKLYR